MVNQYIPVGPNWIGEDSWYRLAHEPLEIDGVNAAEKNYIVHP
jgi:hypothetical protein